MGNKYIIEIPEDKIADFVGSTHFLMPYMMAGHIWHHDTGLPIAPYTEPDMEQVRKEAYDKGYDDATAEIGSDEQAIAEKAYQKGLKDAWDAARTLWNTPNRKEIFGHTTFNTVLTTLTAQETIEKIRQYEQEKEEIQVGDEIETPSGLKGYVVNFTDDELVHYVSSEGRFGTMGTSAVSKTGRHFHEIAEVLAKMKES